MKKEVLVTKQSIGIDVGKDNFYACYKVKYTDGKVVIKGTKLFANNRKGFEDFMIWSNKRNKTQDIELVFLMEATGVYYEELAYFLYGKDKTISVQLAQKIKYFAKSINLKTKTDKVDSKMIAEIAIERDIEKLSRWTPPSKEFKMIRDLAREHTAMKKAKTVAQSQLHAKLYAHDTLQDVIELKQKQILVYDELIDELENKMRELVKKEEGLNEKIRKIETVKGLGFITIIKVISETNGFILFKNIRQLVSYAGLDVVHDESGNHKGKTKISKKGNKKIREALYMPAMTASRHNKILKTYYERINEDRTIKKQGTIAVMRKLLILIYTLWKKDEEYIENYQMT